MSDDVMCACGCVSSDHEADGCTPCRIAYREEAKCHLSEADILRAALAERDAQLARTEERSREWALALQSLTPGGSEYVDDPAACVTFARKYRGAQHESILSAVKARKEAERQLALLRADLREYGRHADGCSAGVGDYPCKCGWTEVEARLKGRTHHG